MLRHRLDIYWNLMKMDKISENVFELNEDTKKLFKEMRYFISKKMKIRARLADCLPNDERPNYSTEAKGVSTNDVVKYLNPNFKGVNDKSKIYKAYSRYYFLLQTYTKMQEFEKYLQDKKLKNKNIYLSEDTDNVKSEIENEYYNDPIAIGFRIGYSFMLYDLIENYFEAIDRSEYNSAKKLCKSSSLHLKLALKYFGINISKYASKTKANVNNSLDFENDLFCNPYLLLGQEVGLQMGNWVFCTKLSPHTEKFGEKDKELNEFLYIKKFLPLKLKTNGNPVGMIFLKILIFLGENPNESYFDGSVKTIKNILEFYPYND